MSCFDPVGFLDLDYYERTYGVPRSDVAKHYFDVTNGRLTNPNPLFDTQWYLQRRPDVAASSHNPLRHFLKWGSGEGMAPHPLLDLDWHNQFSDKKLSTQVDLLVHYLSTKSSAQSYPHPLFASDWYVACHPDVAGFGRDPLVHYIEYGAAERWNPHPIFDTAHYLERCPDAAAGTTDALSHFVKSGAGTRHSPSPLFDAAWYIDTTGPDGLRGLDPISHYIKYGAAAGRDPHPLFATNWYLDRRQDVGAAGINPLVHYVRFGAAEGTDPHPLFNTDWYLRSRPNAARQDANPLAHYLQHGAAERSSPHPLFDAEWYAAHYLDPVARTDIPLVHFVTVGARERRDPHPWFSTLYYVERCGVADDVENVVEAFITRGRERFAVPHPLFDVEWYLMRYNDVRGDPHDAYMHWVAYGLAEGRQPTPLIDHEYYYATYPDIVAAGLSATYHYMASGHAENRNPCALFDTAWYRERNMPGLPQGENPLVHFALHGAGRELDPGPRFSTSAYYDKHEDLRRMRRNGLAHFITWGRPSGAEMSMSDPTDRMSDRYFRSGEISAAAMIGLRESDLGGIQKHFFYSPLNIDIDPRLDASPRVQILMPGLNRRYATGGPNTAYILGCLIAEAGIPVTFVSLDVPPDPDIEPLREHLRSITRLDIGRLDIQFVDGSDRDKPYAIGRKDVFIATAWWTAQAAKSAAALTANSRFFYLIQDLESTFYGGSVLKSVANETYTFDHYPIINTSFLFDQLKADRIGRYADADFIDDAIVFEPAVDRTFFYPRGDHGAGARKLLFYTRPTMAERNLFGLGVAALRAVAADGLFDGSPWEMIGMGESFTPIPLGRGHTLKPAPWLDFAGYAELMRSADVLLSLMFSPHPSYPPLEMAVCGNPVVTTTYGVKTSQRMASLSPSIIAVEPTLEEIAFGITRALARRDRKGGHAGIDPKRLPRSWIDSLSAVLPRVLQHLEICGIVPREGIGPLRPVRQSSHRLLPPAADLEVFRRRNSLRPSSARPLIAIVVEAGGDEGDAERGVVERIVPQIAVARAGGATTWQDDAERVILVAPRVRARLASDVKAALTGCAPDYVIFVDRDNALLPDALDVLRASFEQVGDVEAAAFGRAGAEGLGGRPVPAVRGTLVGAVLDRLGADEPAPLSWSVFAKLEALGVNPFEIPQPLTLGA